MKSKGKRGSFEITLEFDHKKFLIWTGLKLTPRKAKFPQEDHIFQKLNEFFS